MGSGCRGGRGVRGRSGASGITRGRGFPDRAAQRPADGHGGSEHGRDRRPAGLEQPGPARRAGDERGAGDPRRLALLEREHPRRVRRRMAVRAGPGRGRAGVLLRCQRARDRRARECHGKAGRAVGDVGGGDGRLSDEVGHRGGDREGRVRGSPREARHGSSGGSRGGCGVENALRGHRRAEPGPQPARSPGGLVRGVVAARVAGRPGLLPRALGRDGGRRVLVGQRGRRQCGRRRGLVAGAVRGPARGRPGPGRGRHGAVLGRGLGRVQPHGRGLRPRDASDRVPAQRQSLLRLRAGGVRDEAGPGAHGQAPVRRAPSGGTAQHRGRRAGGAERAPGRRRGHRGSPAPRAGRGGILQRRGEGADGPDHDGADVPAIRVHVRGMRGQDGAPAERAGHDRRELRSPGGPLLRQHPGGGCRDGQGRLRPMPVT